jgi:hypothetical protein
LKIFRFVSTSFLPLPQGSGPVRIKSGSTRTGSGAGACGGFAGLRPQARVDFPERRNSRLERGGFRARPCARPIVEIVEPLAAFRIVLLQRFDDQAV